MTELRAYPRPRGDTGIGFRCAESRDAESGGQSPGDPASFHDRRFHDRRFHDWRFHDRPLHDWLAEVGEMGGSWLILPATPGEPVPEETIEGSLAAGIEPVVHLAMAPLRRIEPDEWRPVLTRYAQSGVRYVCAFAEPNRADRWTGDGWRAPDLVGRVTAIVVPFLEAALEAGLWPVLAPLQPGGDYWDLAMLAGVLRRLNRPETGRLLDRLAVGLYNDVGNRPLAWGAGGPERWPGVLPYRVPVGTEDQRGYRLFEWYDSTIRAVLGRSLPLIALRSALVVGDQSDPAYPALDEATHSARAVEIARALMVGDEPDYLFNVAFSSSGEKTGGRHGGDARHRAGDRLPADRALKLLKKQPRPIARQTVESGVTPPTAIAHYVLLVADESGGAGSPSCAPTAGDLLGAVAPYAARLRPTIGFAIHEARGAGRVTIVGVNGSALRAEAELRAAGCVVERVDAPDLAAVRRILDDLTD